jgi:NAD(P)-dependent dehydrogenase (short-subunit alcohol dehydrogenase family)
MNDARSISESSLGGQVAVVTGAARGLGFASAHRLGVAGGRPVLFDIDGDAVGAARDALRAEGIAADAQAVDVRDESSLRTCVDLTLERHGAIDILVNNAGIFPHTPFERLTMEEWRRVFSINLEGIFVCTSAVYPHMRERGYGRIINVSSATFFIGYPEMTAYIASKGGIIGFTRALASEAGPHGITVNCITPGLIETEGALAEDPTGELFEEIIGGQAIKRRGRPEDIAECMAYLASPAAGFITGQTINVDGGHRYH